VPGEQAVFTLADSPHATAARSFRSIGKALSDLLPAAEVEHVGSTAVAGCIGKGDIDVLVRVHEPDFAAAVHALDSLLARSARNEASATYVEYDWRDGPDSASVQLVVAGSSLDDRFHGLKAVLLEDPEAVERYNSLKLGCVGMPMDAYRERKRVLIDELLSSRAGSADATVRPGVRE